MSIEHARIPEESPAMVPVTIDCQWLIETAEIEGFWIKTSSDILGSKIAPQHIDVVPYNYEKDSDGTEIVSLALNSLFRRDNGGLNSFVTMIGMTKDTINIYSNNLQDYTQYTYNDNLLRDYFKQIKQYIVDEGVIPIDTPPKE